MPRVNQKEYQDGMEMGGGTPPEKGEYIVQIEEGCKLELNPNTGKYSYHIPTELVQVVKGKKQGSEESLGMRHTIFVPIKSDFGARQLSAITTLTGIAGKLEEQYPDDEWDSDRVLAFLALNLRGKLLGIEITHEKRGTAEEPKIFSNTKRYFSAPTKHGYTESKKVQEEEDEGEW